MTIKRPSMPDMSLLARLVIEKRLREKLTLRVAAAQTGVPFSTLTRIEHGHAPDVGNFLTICTWLGVSPADFIPPPAGATPGTTELVAKALYSDRRLSITHALRISELVNDLYGLHATKEPADG